MPAARGTHAEIKRAIKWDNEEEPELETPIVEFFIPPPPHPTREQIIEETINALLSIGFMNEERAEQTRQLLNTI